MSTFDRYSFYDLQQSGDSVKQKINNAVQDMKLASSSGTISEGVIIKEGTTLKIQIVDKFADIGDNNKLVVSKAVKGITDLIPDQAGSNNQLADKDFVNSSINNNSAYYITKNANGDPFGTHDELIKTQTFYSGGIVRIPTRNDYCTVLADETQEEAPGLYPTTRYVYQKAEGAATGQWQFQYIVNNTTLTAEQLAALNSKITETKVKEIDEKVAQTSTANQIYGTNDSGDQITYPQSSESATAGTVVVRNANGRIITAEPTENGHAATKKYVDDQIKANITDVLTTSITLN